MNDKVTAGLKWAPEIGPNIRMITTRIAPVGNGVAEQRDRDIAARQRLAHDAGADNGCQQKGRPDSFGDQTASRQSRKT